jgi:hypothetical protein
MLFGIESWTSDSNVSNWLPALTKLKSGLLGLVGSYKNIAFSHVRIPSL